MDKQQNSALPKKYKKEFSHSYTLGPFPTFELLSACPRHALHVYIHEKFHQREKLEALCALHSIPVSLSPKALERIANKEICYAAGVFQKFQTALSPAAPHVVLVNPADMGNLGTILRTVLGFGIKDIAIIEPAADLFNPKVVRASMGAIFRLRCTLFSSFADYLAAYGENRKLFPFMLDSAYALTPESCPGAESYSLIFGNEATGLPPEFQQYGQSLFIAQTPEVDSLNLSVAVGVGVFLFTQKNPVPESFPGNHSSTT